MFLVIYGNINYVVFFIIYEVWKKIIWLNFGFYVVFYDIFMIEKSVD